MTGMSCSTGWDPLDLKPEAPQILQWDCWAMPQNPWNLEACAHTPVWHQVEAQRTAASTAASLQAIRCSCTATTQEQTSPAQVVRLALHAGIAHLLDGPLVSGQVPPAITQQTSVPCVVVKVLGVGVTHKDPGG